MEEQKKYKSREEKVCAGCHENITDSKHGTCNIIDSHREKKKKSITKVPWLLAVSTLIILFVEMFKFCEKYLFQRTKFGEKETFGVF